MAGARCDICWKTPVRYAGLVCVLCHVETRAEKLQRRVEQATRERAERLARER